MPQNKSWVCNASFIHSGVAVCPPFPPCHKREPRAASFGSRASRTACREQEGAWGNGVMRVGITFAVDGWVCEIQQSLAQDLKSASWYFRWLLVLPLWLLLPLPPHQPQGGRSPRSPSLQALRSQLAFDRRLSSYRKWLGDGCNYDLTSAKWSRGVSNGCSYIYICIIFIVSGVESQNFALLRFD